VLSHGYPGGPPAGVLAPASSGSTRQALRGPRALCGLPARSPPSQTYSAELVPLTAEPSGAGFSWMGVGFFLGILHREGASNSEGRAALLASSLGAAPRPPRGTKSGPRALGLPLGGAPRTVRQRLGPAAISEDPCPIRPPLGARGAKGLLRRRGAERDGAGCARSGFPPSFPQSVSRMAPPRAHYSPAPIPARESAAAAAARTTAVRSRLWEGPEGGGGVGNREASPPPGCGALLSPTRLRPHCPPAANGSKALRQMTRKYVTGARPADLGRGPARAPRRPLLSGGTLVELLD
jgi:hypothetical protein